MIDTNNYYPFRDGRIAALDDGMADSVWVAQHLQRPLVKAFNSVLSNSLRQFYRPAGADDRVALPLSGDDAVALKRAASLVEDAGFDAVCIGVLADSWRQQPGSPLYCTDLHTAELQALLPRVVRDRLPALRDAAIRAFMESSPPPTPDQRREIFRRLYLPRNV